MTVTTITTTTTATTALANLPHCSQSNSWMKTGLLLLQAAIATAVVSVFATIDASGSVQSVAGDRPTSTNTPLTQKAF